GWCWHRIVARLRRASRTAVAPDLYALGRDLTPPGSVTLASWTQQIADIVESIGEPVVLVGHSRAGIILSEVAERIPDRIRILVSVAAFLLESGQTLQDAAARIEGSLVPPAMVPSEDGSASLRPEIVREAFYGCCSDEDVTLAQSLLRPEPLAPLATPVRTTC